MDETIGEFPLFPACLPTNSGAPVTMVVSGRINIPYHYPNGAQNDL